MKFAYAVLCSDFEFPHPEIGSCFLPLRKRFKSRLNRLSGFLGELFRHSRNAGKFVNGKKVPVWSRTFDLFIATWPSKRKAVEKAVPRGIVSINLPTLRLAIALNIGVKPSDWSGLSTSGAGA